MTACSFGLDVSIMLLENLNVLGSYEVVEYVVDRYCVLVRN